MEIFRWQKIKGKQAYVVWLNTLYDLYVSSRIFKEDVRQTTKSVLKTKIKELDKLNKAVEEGIHFLIKELAFLCASKEILGEKSIFYIYHKSWSILEKLINGKYDLTKSVDLNFIILQEKIPS